MSVYNPCMLLDPAKAGRTTHHRRWHGRIIAAVVAQVEAVHLAGRELNMEVVY